MSPALDYPREAEMDPEKAEKTSENPEKAELNDPEKAASVSEKSTAVHFTEEGEEEEEEGSVPSISDTTEEKKTSFQWPCQKWCRDRWRTTLWGCLSSATVLTVRLILDHTPSAYVIHSIIILIDMVLIHMFTNSRWLSVAGEATTIIFFLAFHFTKETVFELLETTIIAVLCSFHLIGSRNKAKDRVEHLEVGMENFRRQSMAIMLRRSSQQLGGGDPKELEALLMEEETEELELASKSSSSSNWFIHPQNSVCQLHVRSGLELFFEHFLDGSAGVMVRAFSFLR